MNTDQTKDSRNTSTNTTRSVQPASPADFVLPTGRIRHDGLAQINHKDIWQPAVEHYGKPQERSLDALQYVNARDLRAPDGQVFLVIHPDNDSTWRAAYAALDKTGKFPLLKEYPRWKWQYHRQLRAKFSILAAIEEDIPNCVGRDYLPASSIADIAFRDVQRLPNGQFTHNLDGTPVVFDSGDVVAAMQLAIVNEALGRIRRVLQQYGYQPYGCLIVGAIVTTVDYNTIYDEQELSLSIFHQADFAPGLEAVIRMQGAL